MELPREARVDEVLPCLSQMFFLLWNGVSIGFHQALCKLHSL